jgi:hypothetical protein
MKITYLIIILFSFSPNLFGQGYKLVAIAGNGKKDSVRFGFRDNATMGIDANLGEVNISNQPSSEVDIRVVQRDSVNFSCTYTFVRRTADTIKHFFPINFDSKVNYRKKSDTSFINRIFEVKFLTKNIVDIELWAEPLTSGSVLDSFGFFIDSCLKKVNLVSIDLNSTYPIKIRGGSIFSNLIFVFKKGFILPNEENFNKRVTVYPNPCKNQLNIDVSTQNQVKNIVIFDIFGREILKKEGDYGEHIDLDVSSLNRGTYFISGFNETSQSVFSKLIVKE